MFITSDLVKHDFEVIGAELMRRRADLQEILTFVYAPRIASYEVCSGRPAAEKADDASVRLAAVEKRQRAIDQLERQLETDISRIEGCFKGWETSQKVLRLRYVQGMSVDEAAEMVFGVRRSGCDNWSCYRQRAFRLERRAFEEIASQVR